MIRIVSGALLCVGSSLIGMAVRRHFKGRNEIYLDICVFLNVLKNEIGCLKTPIGGVVKNFCEEKKGAFAAVLKQYYEDLNKGMVNENYIEKIQLKELKAAEKKEIFKFLTSLGKLPLKEQMLEIESWSQKFSDAQKKTQEEAKRLGGMYFKLCVLLGFALMIIVI